MTEAAALTFFAVLGLIIGSFLNVVIHRLPQGQSVVTPRSRCASCGGELRAIDNVPVVSYLMLGGRCRQCQARISIRYPIVELATMAVFVAHYLLFGLDILLVPRLLFAAALIVLFAIDLEHHLLPNAITLPGILVGLAFSVLLPPGILAALIGTLVGGGVLWAIGEGYYRLTGQEGMGGGDVKMLAMIGAFLGWKLVLVTLVFSSIAGSLIGIVVLATRRGGMKYAPPYGTFLALGALVASLFGEHIVSWYVGLYDL
jgi:leader peptidase (prepilin peptidase)/N-methyltransferase